jgi:hypothetical protein
MVCQPIEIPESLLDDLRSIIVLSTTPSVKRVTRELLGQIATQTSVSGFVLFVITPRPWARSFAESGLNSSSLCC